jgi:hypothetical protein
MHSLIILNNKKNVSINLKIINTDTYNLWFADDLKVYKYQVQRSIKYYVLKQM